MASSDRATLEEASLAENEWDEPVVANDVITPGEILNKLGPRNPFLLSCISITGLSWMVAAMNGMSPAFITLSCENCSDMVSLVDEYGLRGPRAYLSDATTTAFTIGNGFGGLFVSDAADRFDRRPVLISCFVIMALLGTVAAYSPSVMVFGILRFMQGICYTGVGSISWILGYENTPVKLRFFTSVYYGMAWVAGYCLVAPLVMITPSWRWLIFLVSVPHLINATLCYFFVPESLHYLVIRHRGNDVGDWLKKAGRRSDGVADIDPTMIVSTRQVEPNSANLFVELWAHKRFLWYTIILIYLWNCDTFIYSGLSLYSTHFAGNIYLSYLLVGMVELPAYILSPAIMNRCGRRIFVAFTHLLAAGTFFGLIFTSETGWTRTALWTLGKFEISCSYMSIYVYASEIFPTDIRGSSIGFCQVTSSIGAILSPYVVTLGRLSPILTMLVLSLISVIGGLITFLLPETLNRQLPSTISEASERL